MTAIPARRWRWPAELATPRKARQVTRRFLDKWNLTGITDEVVQLVSELVANAVKYGGSPVTLTLRPDGQGVRCEVGDPDPIMPLGPPVPLHGLSIVYEFADHVWVTTRRSDGGKLVCFTLRDGQQ